MGSVLGFPAVDPTDAAIGQRLKRWRIERHVELEDLAVAMHVDPGVLRRVEAGREHLTSSQIGAATTTLHLPLWALVSDVPAY